LIAGVPWDIVRKADAAGGSEHAEVVGRIVGADVKVISRRSCITFLLTPTTASASEARERQGKGKGRG
jgi:hypothetical protein